MSDNANATRAAETTCAVRAPSARPTLSHKWVSAHQVGAFELPAGHASSMHDLCSERRKYLERATRIELAFSAGNRRDVVVGDRLRTVMAGWRVS